MYDEHRFVTPDGLITLGGNRKKVNAILTRFNELDLKIRLIKLRRSRPARRGGLAAAAACHCHSGVPRRAAGAQHAEPGASPAPSGSGNIRVRVTGTSG
jgi:hypothetical protein